MICCECDKNGISPFKKLGLIIGLNFRCSQCGTEFTLNKGIALIISMLVQISILFSVFFAFIHMATYLAYGVLVLALTFIGVLVVLLPVKVSSKIGIRQHVK